MSSNVDTFRDFEPFGREPHRAFAARRKSPDANTALVFLDANVLLAPYKSSTQTLEAISKTYEQLRKQERLFVPAQAAREFARHRCDHVAALHKNVRDGQGLELNYKFSPAPILLSSDNCGEALKKLENARKSIKEFKRALRQLESTVADWQASDPVLETYERLFDKSNVIELSIATEALESIRKARYERRVPPGFKDKGKDDGGGGDLAIWLTILHIAASSKRDVLFVTEEKKVDWFHRSGDDPLFPRYELIEEFDFHSAGKSFGILTLADLLKSYGAAPEVVEELRVAAAVRDSPFWSAQAADIGIQDSEERLVGRIAQRLTECGGAVLQGDFETHPDLFVTTADGILGVSITQITETGDAVYRRIADTMLFASKVAHRHGLREHVVVFATALPHVLRAVNAWLVKAGYPTGAVGAALADARQERLLFARNHTMHPLFALAFAPGTVA